MGFYRARSASFVERARARIQSGGNSRPTFERRRKHSAEHKTAPACQFHHDPDAFDQAAARGKYARRICGSEWREIERRKNNYRGRCFHNRRDDERVRTGVAESGRRRGLRLDSRARALVCFNQSNGHHFVHEEINQRRRHH
jgi:hypothetical protein